MKLSEAILLGIGLVKEDRRTFGAIDTPGQYRGCAVTTALVAIGKFNVWKGHLGSARLEEFWPWTAQPFDTSNPLSSLHISMVISLRHCGGESRESIAKWIAAIEPQESVGVTQVEANEVSHV